jgi:hypothetical protein
MPTESIVATNAIMWDINTSSFFDRTSSADFLLRHTNGDDDDDPSERQAALSFDTATALKGSDDITSATLTLKFSASETGLNSIVCLAAYDLNAIPANISGATSFIYGRPSRENIVKSIGSATSGDTITFDVANQIRQIICSPQWAGGTIVLVLYYMGLDSDAGKNATFHSIGATNAADRPKLDITWTSGSGNASNADTTANFSVTAGSDDGYAKDSAFVNNLNHLNFGNFPGDDDDNPDNVRSFVRFTNVTIPQGKTINAAIIELKSISTHYWRDNGYILYGDDSDNATAPTNATEYDAKAKTTASNSGVFDRAIDQGGITNYIRAYTQGQKVYFPCTQQLQEIVDRSGFSSSNNVQFLFNSQTLTTDNGVHDEQHKFASFENTTYEEPILRVSYGDGGGGGGGGESSSVHIQRTLLGVG